MKQFSKDELLEAAKSAKTKKEVYLNLGITTMNGRYTKMLKEQFELHNVDLDMIIFNNLNIEKTCPVCNSTFIVSRSVDLTKPKTTCSYSCSNTYFRTGTDHPNFDSDSTYAYRFICFANHEKKCVVCDEQNIVAVHHYDENHSNNDPANLVPLCPTHHSYIHSNFKHLIEEQVHQYVLNWKKINET